MAAQIIATEEDTNLLAAQEGKNKSARIKLVEWVTGKVRPWEDFRKANYDQRWEEYYRLWRGIWDARDKQRKSERSRLIAPALQQAVESVTSEIESAVLDQAALFDIVDDVKDTATQQDKDMLSIRASLREDMNEAQFSSAMSQIFLNGSIYGTGIGKLDVNEVTVASIVQGEGGTAELSTDQKVMVGLSVVLPQQFVIDTAAKTLNDGLGAAHMYSTPLHQIKEAQDKGTYLSGDVGSEAPKDTIESDTQPDTNADSVNIIDYRGKVPAHLLRAVAREELEVSEDDEEVVALFPDDNETELVEAFILIGNGATLLKAKENLTLLKERLFLAYRHEIVPDQFWGRGVCEKGYNSQKALDGSLRARMDGLALTIHPMMGIDGTRMPRGFRFTVSPGRNVITNGDPEQILRPLKFGSIDPNIFTDNAELERMVTMSTGGIDASAPVKVNNRNETASGMSMQLGSFVKRSKRTIRNIEEEFVVPMVKTVSNLYMQFAPGRYPVTDVTFRAVSVLGNMARELEQMQFTQMLQTTSPDNPAYWLIMRSIYESSDLKNREQLLEYIDIELDRALNPEPPPPDPLVEIKRMTAIAQVKAETSRIQVEYIRAQAEIARAANDARTAESEEAKNESQAILNLARAEAQAIGSQKEELTQWLNQLEQETNAEEGLADAAVRRAIATGTGSDIGNGAQSGVGISDGGVAA